MKHSLYSITTAAFFILSCIAATSATAQSADASGEEVAQTPSSLAELLGPDGLDAAEFDFYLHMQVEGPSVEEGGPGIEDSVMHWQLAVEDERVIFTMRMVMGDDVMEAESFVYSRDGEFVESSHTRQGGGWASTRRTVREGETLRVTRHQELEFDAGENEDEDEEVRDYQPLGEILPTAWLPLVFAYHIREGHDRFEIRMADENLDGWAMVSVVAVEDIRTELVEVGAQEFEAHVMLAATSTALEGELPDDMRVDWDESEHTMQMLVLADGTIVGMQMELDGTVVSSQPVTAEEAEALIADGMNDDAAE